MRNKIVQLIKSINWSEIPPITYVRYILMILTVINTFLTRIGLNPIPVSEEELYQVVSDIIAISVLIMNTWCNNSVTEQAIVSDQIMKELKDCKQEDPKKYDEYIKRVKTVD